MTGNQLKPPADRQSSSPVTAINQHSLYGEASILTKRVQAVTEEEVGDEVDARLLEAEAEPHTVVDLLDPVASARDRSGESWRAHPALK